MKFLLFMAALLISSIAYADSPEMLFIDSDSGSDANSCTSTAPCKTTATALAKVTTHTQAIVLNGVMYRCGRNGACYVPIKI